MNNKSGKFFESDLQSFPQKIEIETIQIIFRRGFIKKSSLLTLN